VCFEPLTRTSSCQPECAQLPVVTVNLKRLIMSSWLCLLEPLSSTGSASVTARCPSPSHWHGVPVTLYHGPGVAQTPPTARAPAGGPARGPRPGRRRTRRPPESGTGSLSGLTAPVAGSPALRLPVAGLARLLMPASASLMLPVRWHWQPQPASSVLDSEPDSEALPLAEAR
jgi:hypothetical protein